MFSQASACDSTTVPHYCSQAACLSVELKVYADSTWAVSSRGEGKKVRQSMWPFQHKRVWSWGGTCRLEYNCILDISQNLEFVGFVLQMFVKIMDLTLYRNTAWTICHVKRKRNKEQDDGYGAGWVPVLLCVFLFPPQFSLVSPQLFNTGVGDSRPRGRLSCRF